MKIEKSSLWNGTTPFTDSERAWLTSMLSKEARTQKDWAEITELVNKKTVFSLMPQGNSRFEKYSRSGILYDPTRQTMFAGTTLKELEILQSVVFGQNRQPSSFVVTIMSYRSAAEAAVREGVYLMLDQYTSGCIRFLSFNGRNGQINATMALDLNAPDADALLKAALKNGGRFA